MSAEPSKSAAQRQRARVLVVDDSVVARSIFARIIDDSSGFMTAGAVGNARAALAFLSREAVDIILLDVEMPGLDGLSALPEMLVAGRGARVMVVSSSCDEGAATTIQALALGAADTLVKPGVGSFAGKFGVILEERMTRLMDSAAVQRHDHPSSLVPFVAPLDPFDVIAIGASTGGIHALSQLFRNLPTSVRVPILVTQHLPASFMPYFAAQLAVLSGRPCEVVRDGTRIRPGHIHVAPGTAHLRCVRMSEGASLRHLDGAMPSGCLPSVDPMFESVADVFGSRALGIVLSGMGRDGAKGAADIAAAGGTVLVQDAATSVVWGMPGVIAEAGIARAILPPDEIGRLITRSHGRRT